MQLAVRNDTETDDFSRSPSAPDASNRMRASFNGTVYTAGAKVSPTRWLMLRASYATGATPPPLASLIETDVVSNFRPVNDPKRGRGGLAPGPSFLYKTGGSPDLGTVQASTASLGGILTPFGEEGPRLTLDYSRIRRTHDVFTPSDQFVFDHEDAWPGRVTRAPLTDADRARGYTAGAVTMIDARPANAGGLKVDTVDARLEWRLPILGGRLRLYGDATYYLRQVQTSPFRDEVELVDYLGRPLARRGNAGAEWSMGPVTIGANLQHFGSYRIFPQGQTASSVASAISLQGTARVPSQSYVDLHASWRGRLRVAGAAQDLRIDLGVVNVLDRAPPRESSYSLAQFNGIATAGPPGYSRYGDPRQRRFLLTVSAAF